MVSKGVKLTSLASYISNKGYKRFLKPLAFLLAAFLVLLAVLVPHLLQPREVLAGVATRTLGELPRYSLVVDKSWVWEHRLGVNYTDFDRDGNYLGPGELKPVTWYLFYKDFYDMLPDSGSIEGSHVTLLSLELIGRLPYDSDTIIWSDCDLRKFLNGSYCSEETVYNTTFYDEMSQNFQEAIMEADLISRISGTAYVDYHIDKIYLGCNQIVGRLHERSPAKLGEEYQDWWYRFSESSVSEPRVRIVKPDGNTVWTVPWSSIPGIRPVLNLSPDTPVSLDPNEDGVYEIVWVLPDAGKSEVDPPGGLTIEPYDSSTFVVTVIANTDTVPPTGLAIGPDPEQVSVTIQRSDGEDLSTYDWIASVEYNYDYGAANQVQVTINAGPVHGSANDLVIKADRTVLRDDYAITVDAPPGSLRMVSQPSSGTAGERLDFDIAVEDRFGNPLVGDNNTVVYAVARNGSGELMGTTTATASAGIASFSLIYEKAEEFTVEFFAFHEFTRFFVVSENIQILPCSLDHFLVKAAGGGDIPEQVVGDSFYLRLTARDQFGNTVDSFNSRVELSSSSQLVAGGGTTEDFTGGVLESHEVVLGEAGLHTVTVLDSSSAKQGVSNLFYVDKGTPVVTWPEASPITYGETLIAAELTGGAASVPGDFAFVKPEDKPGYAGKHNAQIIFNPEDTANYYPATRLIEVTVNKKVLTVTARDTSKIYGEADPGFTVDYAGFIPDEDENVLGGAIAFTRVEGENVGQYAVTPAGLASNNYDFIYEDGKLTIHQAPLTVRAEDVSKTYGERDPGFAASYAGFVLGDEENVLDGEINFTRQTGEDAGDYVITVAGDLSAQNYLIIYESGTLTIHPAPIIVRANDSSKIYGEDDPPFSVTYQGFQYEDSEEDLEGDLSITREPGRNAGWYAINVTGSLSHGNYYFTYENGWLHIQRALLNVIPASASKVYGEPDPPITVTYDGFQYDDSEKDLVAYLYMHRDHHGESVGSYYEFSPAGNIFWKDGSTNYEVWFNSGGLTITPAPLTVTVGNYVKRLGEDDPEFSVSYHGFVFQEDESVLSGTLHITRQEGEQVGEYAITPSGLINDNYQITFVPGRLIITRETYVSPAALEYIVGSGVEPQITLFPEHGCTLLGISDGEGDLTLGLDYTVSGEVYIIASSYLEGRELGDLALTFRMDTGESPTVVITVRLSDEEAVAADKEALSLTFADGDTETRVTQPLKTLSAAGANGTVITYSSSHPHYLSHDGQTLNRPSYTTGDVTVTLTATISKGSAVATRAFNLVIMKLGATDAEAVALDKEALQLVFAEGDTAESVTSPLGVLPLAGSYETIIAWESSRPDILSHDAQTLNRPAYTTGDEIVYLGAVVRRGLSVSIKKFELLIKSLPPTDEESVELDKDALELPFADGDTPESVTLPLGALPNSGAYDTVITWESSLPEVLSHDGQAVNRPAYRDGDAAVTFTATITRGEVTTNRVFSLTILKLPVTDGESVEMAVEALTIPFTYPDDAAGVTKNLSPLPLSGIYDTSIIWSSSRPEFISNTGAVIRPARAHGDAAVTLTASITKGTASVIREFPLIVLADLESPAIISSDPADEASNVPRNKVIQITFSKDIQPGPAFEQIFLFDSAGFIELDTTVVGRTLTVSPLTNLDSNADHTLGIPAGAVTDLSGNPFEVAAGGVVITFKTAASLYPPEMVSSNPAEGSENLSLNPELEIVFHERIHPGVNWSNIRLLDDDGNRVETAVSVENRTLTIRPLYILQGNTDYRLIVPAAGVQNSSHVSSSSLTVNFSTGRALVESTPRHNETGVAVNRAIEVRFSSPITEAAGYTEIALQNARGSTVPATLTIQDNSLTLSPGSDLEFGSTYTVIIPPGAVRDSTGELNGSYIFKFTTAKKIPDILVPFNYSPPRHLLGDEVEFKASYVFLNQERIYGRTLVHCSWDMGDGETRSGQEFVYTYANPGVYEVTLTVTDDKGQQYTWTAEVIVEPLDNFTMTVSPRGTLLVYEPEDGSQVASHVTYTVLLDADGMPMQNRDVTVWRGDIQIATITTGSEGRAVFTSTSREFEPGNNILTFRYEDRQVDRLVRMVSGSVTSSIYRFMVEGYTEEELEGLAVRLNGNRVTVYRDGDGYYYLLDVPMGLQKITISSNYYYDIEKEVDFYGIEHTDILKLVPDIPAEDPVIVFVKTRAGASPYSDSSQDKEGLFFQGVESRVDLEVRVDWKGHKPGYVQFGDTKLSTVVRRPGHIRDHISEINMGEQSRGRHEVEAVSAYGRSSQAVDTGFLVVERPPLGSIVFRRAALGHSNQPAGYALTLPLGIPGMNSPRAPSYMPVVGGGTIGTDQASVSFSGELDKDFNVLYGLGIGVGTDNRGKRDKEAEKAGEAKAAVGPVEFSGSYTGQLRYSFNKQGRWECTGGYIILYIEGEKGVQSKGISLGPVKVEPKGSVGLGIQTTLGLEYNRKWEFYGEVGLVPFASLSLKAGVSGFNVTGSLRGSIPVTFKFSPDLAFDVKGSIRGSAKVTALFFSTSFDVLKYDWTIFSTRAVASRMGPVFALAELDTAEFEAMSRDYLKRQSGWLPGDDSLTIQGMRAGEALVKADVENLTLQTDIYPEPQPAMENDGDDHIMVWVADNPLRSDMNRTELIYSVSDGSGWQAPEFMGFSNTAEFNPVLARTDNRLLLAWQKIKREFDDDAVLDDLLAASEIAVAYRDENGAWTGFQYLTDNDYLDHLPSLAAGGDQAILTWIRNRSHNYFGSTEEPNEIMFSRWDGSTWSEPDVITEGLGLITGSSLAFNGEQGVFFFSVDVDGDLDTEEDQEIYAIFYDGDQWGEPVGVTNNNVPDTNPQAAYVNGELLVVWTSDDDLVYLKGGHEDEPTLVDADFRAKGDDGLVAEMDYLLVTGGESRVALIYSRLTGEGTDIHTLFYDAAEDLWSGEIRLTDNGEKISSPQAATIDGGGNVRVAYKTVELLTVVIDGEEYSHLGRTDLMMATLYPDHDPAILEGDIRLSQENPVPGSSVAITAEISNLGEFPVRNVEVDFYDGNPDNGGVKIGTRTIDTAIPARGSANASLNWTVPDTGKGHTIYVVVDPHKKLHDRDRSNNLAALLAVTPDLELEALDYRVDGTRYIFTAAIANIGAIDLEGSAISLYEGAEAVGAPLLTVPVPALQSGERTEVSFTWDASGKEIGEEGLPITVLLTAPEGVAEYRIDNNIFTKTLYRQRLRISSFAPAGNSLPVLVDQEIRLNFNMEIEPDRDYHSVVLLDHWGVAVPADKELNGSTLTLTPAQPLDYDKPYTFILSADAVKGPHDNALRQDFVLQFTTAMHHVFPAVIFTFPVDGMTGIPADEEIVIRFSEGISPASNFGDISITSDGGRSVEFTTHIQGDILELKPRNKLESHTRYTVYLPQGAVVGSEGRSNDSPYTFSFTTMEYRETDPPGNGDDNGTGVRPPGDSETPVGGTPVGESPSPPPGTEDPDDELTTPGVDEPAADDDEEDRDKDEDKDEPSAPKKWRSAAVIIYYAVGGLLIITPIGVYLWRRFRKR